MDYKNVWDKITSALYRKTEEFPTTPTTNTTPVWFSAHSNGRTIEITSAIHHRPSSKISGIRILTEDEFEDMYPLYLRRERGESVSKEAREITFNSVYYFSLIAHLG